MANDNRYVSKSNFIYIWDSIWKFISNKFVKKEVFDEKIEELKDDIADSFNADEVYIMSETDTEDDIPDNAVVVVFPNEDAEEIDWTNYYTKPEINEIIIRADFKKGKSAYEVAVEQGFEGSQEEWVASLKGNPFVFEDFTAEQLALLRFKYEDFTAEQLAVLKGEPFTYEDFTDEQLEGLKFKFEDFTEEELQLLKGEPFRYEDFTQEQLEDLKPKKNVDYFDGKDGQDGQDGVTPQRGVHYWTNEDIATIQTYVDIVVSELVDTAPETLDTLWELANALGNDPNFATTVATEIGKKVDAVQGKGLSSNDYTTAEKNKLAGIAENANNYSHPANHPASMITGLSKVATTNSYNDLDNKPTIPTIPSSLPANGGNADTVDGLHASSLAKVSSANQFDGEQKFIHSSYVPSVTDSATGVGCAFKASRGLFNEALIDKIIMTSSTGKIPFYKYTGTNGGSMSGLTQVSYVDGNGVYQGSADKVDGYHIKTSNSAPTTNDTSVITFVV